MILDSMERLGCYLPASVRESVVAFVSGLSADSPDGEYKIIGDSVFARVQSYPLKTADMCKVEAHDAFIDIQSVLSGAEGIDIFERAELSVNIPYHAASDVVFLNPGKVLHSVAIQQGHFVVLFPHEAHRPQMEAPDCRFVKKFVIKVRISLWD